jgi:hypothetical protein
LNPIFLLKIGLLPKEMTAILLALNYPVLPIPAVETNETRDVLRAGH